VLSRSRPKSLSETSRKVISIGNSDLDHYLLDAQETIFKQFLGFLHAQLLLILLERHACVGLENVPEPRRGKIYSWSDFVQRHLTPKIPFQVLDDYLDSFLHKRIPTINLMPNLPAISKKTSVKSLVDCSGCLCRRPFYCLSCDFYIWPTVIGTYKSCGSLKGRPEILGDTDRRWWRHVVDGILLFAAVTSRDFCGNRSFVGMTEQSIGNFTLLSKSLESGGRNGRYTRSTSSVEFQVLSTVG